MMVIYLPAWFLIFLILWWFGVFGFIIQITIYTCIAIAEEWRDVLKAILTVVLFWSGVYYIGIPLYEAAKANQDVIILLMSGVSMLLFFSGCIVILLRRKS